MKQVKKSQPRTEPWAGQSPPTFTSDKEEEEEAVRWGCQERAASWKPKEGVLQKGEELTVFSVPEMSSKRETKSDLWGKHGETLKNTVGGRRRGGGRCQ